MALKCLMVNLNLFGYLNLSGVRNQTNHGRAAPAPPGRLCLSVCLCLFFFFKRRLLGNKRRSRDFPRVQLSIYSARPPWSSSGLGALWGW